MEKIIFHVVFHLKPGAADDFKALVDQFVAAAQGEPGTLGYDFYANDDETRFISLEIYENSEAVLAHQSHNKPMRDKAAELTDLTELQVLGSPSEAVRKELAGSNPDYCDPVNGVTR